MWTKAKMEACVAGRLYIKRCRGSRSESITRVMRKTLVCRKSLQKNVLEEMSNEETGMSLTRAYVTKIFVGVNTITFEKSRIVFFFRPVLLNFNFSPLDSRKKNIVNIFGV